MGIISIVEDPVRNDPILHFLELIKNPNSPPTVGTSFYLEDGKSFIAPPSPSNSIFSLGSTYGYILFCTLFCLFFSLDFFLPAAWLQPPLSSPSAFVLTVDPDAPAPDAFSSPSFPGRVNYASTILATARWVNLPFTLSHVPPPRRSLE